MHINHREKHGPGRCKLKQGSQVIILDARVVLQPNLLPNLCGATTTMVPQAGSLGVKHRPAHDRVEQCVRGDDLPSGSRHRGEGVRVQHVAHPTERTEDQGTHEHGTLRCPPRQISEHVCPCTSERSADGFSAHAAHVRLYALPYGLLGQPFSFSHDLLQLARHRGACHTSASGPHLVVARRREPIVGYVKPKLQRSNVHHSSTRLDDTTVCYRHLRQADVKW